MGYKSSPFLLVDNSYSTDIDGNKYDTSTSLFQTNYRLGDDRPNFAQIIKDGGNATNDLHGVLYSGKVDPGFVVGQCTACGPDAQTVYSTFCGLGITWDNDDDVIFPPDLQDESKAIARSRAWSKISEIQRGSFNGYVFLGEFAQTARMLTNPLKESIKLTRDLLKVRGKASIKDFGDLWLQYRFGILPFISDMSEISKLLSEQTEERVRERFRFYGKASKSITEKYESSSPGFIATAHGYTDKIYDAETIIRFGMQTNLIDSTSTLQSRALSTLDLTKVLPAAWELVPWSFLIDYFVNIGDIVATVSESSSVLSYNVESNIKTVTKRTTVKDWVSAWPEGFEIISQTPKTVTVKRREVHRKGGTLEIPPLTFTLPGSDVRLKNIAALLTKLL